MLELPQNEKQKKNTLGVSFDKQHVLLILPRAK